MAKTILVACIRDGSGLSEAISNKLMDSSHKVEIVQYIQNTPSVYTEGHLQSLPYTNVHYPSEFTPPLSRRERREILRKNKNTRKL